MKVIYEEFRSLDHLMRELHKRPNSKIMQGKNSSLSGREEFTGTESYEIAEKMLVNGYLEILPKLRKDVKNKNKISSKYASDIQHSVPHTAPVGYVPCVPAALLSLPNSMITVDRKPMKRKTLSIIYSVSANASTNASWFSEAGAAMLSAIDITEKSGIQTEIWMNFYAAKCDNELVFPTVKIKNYGERYSLQKISFPIANPSMFRRIGFKWLETSPDITVKDFRYGYGSSPGFDVLNANVKIKQNTYLLSAEYIHKLNCDVEKILKKLEVIT